MTRTLTSVLTVIAAILFILLTQVFGGGLFGPPLWSGEQWIDSALITYLLLALITIAGWLQARGLPAEGVALRPPLGAAMPGHVEDPRCWRLLTGNVYYGLIWLPVRFDVGREWLSSGVGKLGDPAWMDTGEALAGFFQSAVATPEAPARPRITNDWYRELLQFVLDREASTWFAPIIAWGETLIGLGLLFAGWRTGRHRGLFRHRDELQRPAGGHRQLEPGPLRTRRLSGAGVEGRRLLGS